MARVLVLREWIRRRARRIECTRGSAFPAQSRHRQRRRAAASCMSRKVDAYLRKEKFDRVTCQQELILNQDYIFPRGSDRLIRARERWWTAAMSSTVETVLSCHRK